MSYHINLRFYEIIQSNILCMRISDTFDIKQLARHREVSATAKKQSSLAMPIEAIMDFVE